MTHRKRLIEDICALHKNMKSSEPDRVEFTSMTTADIETRYKQLCVEYDIYMESGVLSGEDAIGQFEKKIEGFVSLGSQVLEKSRIFISSVFCYILGV